MEIDTASYALLESILGKNWGGESRRVLRIPGYVDIHFTRIDDNLYSLATYWDYKGTALEDPEVIFSADHDRRLITVVSQTDFFHHDGAEPRRRHRVAADDPALAAVLDAYLSDWLGYIRELRPALDEHRC
jgi:hypothetical protein